MGFSGSSAVKEPACRVGDSGNTCSIPKLRGSPGAGHGKSF